MTKNIRRNIYCAIFIACFSGVTAQYTDIVTFNTAVSPKGRTPLGNVVRGGNSLYGMTSGGGANGFGDIFSVDTNGNNYKDLLDFNNTSAPMGSTPEGTLLLVGYKLYGMTQVGGAHGLGNIFSIDTNGGAYNDLYDFSGGSGGSTPFGSLIIVGNKFYGMTQAGGTLSGGNVFSIDTNGGAYKDLWDFAYGVSANGAYPYGTLVHAANKLYGMTQYGGANNLGVIFSVDTNGGAFKKIIDFNGASAPIGATPRGSLTISGKVLYGMTENGGSSNDGVIFSVDTNGTNYKDLQDFNNANGLAPYGDVVLYGKNLYGMAQAGIHTFGNIFVIDTNGTGFNQIFGFSGANGRVPLSSVTISGGMMYGMTHQGGTHNAGVVFAFNPFIKVGTKDTNIVCHGASTGIATSIATGGIRPYTYLWSPSGGTDSTATGLSAGTYTVYVKDIYGNNDSAVVNITQPNALNVSASTTANVSCNGGSNGSASSTASAGTAPYTYAWTPSGGSNSTASGLTAGTYTITVHDACGATATASTTITQPTALSVSASTTANVSCSGGSNGATSSIVSGGNSPYTYAWTPSGGNGPTANGLTAGTYTLTITDFNGCTGSASTLITEPSALSISASTTANVSCNSGNTGAAASTVSGGTSPYTYAWTPSGGNGPTANGLTAGTYTLTVTDFNGCTGSASTVITQPGVLSVSASTAANVSCNGGSNGSTSSTVSGGTTPYTYAWTPSGGNGPTANGLTAGTYTLTVTDFNGCTGSASTLITEPSALSVSASTTANVSCNSGNTGATASVVSGGISPYTYTWTPSGGNGPTANGLTAGTYTLTITDFNGCTGSASTLITEPSALSVSASTTANVSCNSGNTGATASVVSGGTSPYTYAWTPSGGNNPTATGLTAGTYTLTVTDFNGCTGSASTLITEPSALSVSASTTMNVICGGNNGATASTVSGGTTPYAYSWSGGGGTNSTASGLTAGTYTLTVTDFNGCTGTASTTITQPGTFIVSINVTSNISCNGGNNGSASSIVSGGVPPYTYSWSPSGGTNSSASGLTAGTYNLTVFDINGCTGTASAIITQPAVISVAANITADVSCHGGSNGSLSSTVGGGTTPYTYSWSGGGGTNATAMNLTAGSYTLNATDINGCTGSATTIITQPNAINIVLDSIRPSTAVSCNGSLWAHVSGGTSPYTYLWTGGGTTDSIFGQCVGNYCCKVTDANGCKDSACADLTPPTGISGINPIGPQIRVYPNPTSGIFMIELSGITDKSTVECYNMLGEQVYTHTIDGGFNILEMDTQPNGIYLYRITSDSGNLLGQGKLIIQK